MLVGTNPMECQTNLFLNHMVNGLKNGAKVIVVDPRRTVTVDSCEQVAGAENVLDLAIASGSDLELFNTLFIYITDQGWVDADFIAKSTFEGDVAVPEDAAHPASFGSFDATRTACKMSLADGAALTCLTEAQIIQAAEWIAKPKDDGSRTKTVTGCEKGIIWCNDNCRVIGAPANIGPATSNTGREDGGVYRLCGYQEGYFRPSDAHVGRPAPYIDQLIIAGGGKVHHI